MTRSTDRAQVASLGSLLLVAVVVISAGTFGAYYVVSTTNGTAGGAAGGADSAEGLDIAVEAAQDELRLSHNGGTTVSTSNLQLIVENPSDEYTYAFDDGTIRGGDGDSQFDPGETWRLEWDQSPNTEVTISLVNTDANRLVFQRTVTTGSPATERPTNLAGGAGTVSGGGAEEPAETEGEDGEGGEEEDEGEDDDGDKDEGEDDDDERDEDEGENDDDRDDDEGEEEDGDEGEEDENEDEEEDDSDNGRRGPPDGTGPP